MHRLPPHMLLGLFTLFSLLLAGAAVGRFIGLSAGEGAYLSALALACLSAAVGRKRREKQP